MTPKELKLWKKYHELVDRLNAGIREQNNQEMLNNNGERLRPNYPPPAGDPNKYTTPVINLPPLPVLKNYIEPTIVGFYDFISGYTKKEIKK